MINTSMYGAMVLGRGHSIRKKASPIHNSNSMRKGIINDVQTKTLRVLVTLLVKMEII